VPRPSRPRLCRRSRSCLLLAPTLPSTVTLLGRRTMPSQRLVQKGTIGRRLRSIVHRAGVLYRLHLLCLDDGALPHGHCPFLCVTFLLLLTASRPRPNPENILQWTRGVSRSVGAFGVGTSSTASTWRSTSYLTAAALHGRHHGPGHHSRGCVAVFIANINVSV